MINGFAFFLVLLLGVIALKPAMAQDDENDEDAGIFVKPRYAELSVGDTLQFQASLMKTDSSMTDTTFIWSVENDEVGTVDSTGTFVARANGETKVYAGLDSLSGVAMVKVGEDDEFGDDNDSEWPDDSLSYGLHIKPRSAHLAINDSLQFQTWFIDSTGQQVDTAVTFGVADTTVGSINENGWFFAEKEGKTVVWAQADSMMVRAWVKVDDEGSEGDDGDHEGDYDHEEDMYKIVLAPQDTMVTVGDSVQYNATVYDTSGAVVDTTVSWYLKGHVDRYGDDHEGWDDHDGHEDDDGNYTESHPMVVVGRIDSTGLFEALHNGTAFVEARLGESKGRTSVIVQDTTTDADGLQMITINRVKHSNNWMNWGDDDHQEEHEHEHLRQIREGESYRLHGFPFPYNILNGGLLTFPKGSISQDITLTIDIPKGFRPELTDSTFAMPDSVLGGATFNVSVNDTVKHPFFFDKPIKLAIPFKRGLLDKLGITNEQLNMFFYDDSTGFDGVGITDVVVDSAANRIFANVEHFTTVVIASEQSVVTAESPAKVDTRPDKIALKQNYPNPFNPTTTISYELNETVPVKLEVFNTLGQKVAVLVNKRQQAGNYSVQFKANNLSSGVYLYRLQAGDFSRIRSMTLIK